MVLTWFGIVTNWEALEDIVHFSLKDHMCVDSREHPIIFTEPVFNPSANRAKLLELFFEKFETPGMYLAKDAVMASFSVGKPTSLVLDLGAGVSSAIPVNDGFVLHQGNEQTGPRVSLFFKCPFFSLSLCSRSSDKSGRKCAG